MIASISQDLWLSQYFSDGAFKLEINDSVDKKLNLEIELPNGFIYSKVPIERVDLVRFLMSRGFYLVETHVAWKQFKRYETTRPNKDIKIRPALTEDLKDVRSIAGSIFQYSRFHQDKDIPKVLSDKIKADWVENFFKGKRGDQMFIATLHEQVVGFIMLINKNVIDLIAIAQGYARQGIASHLIQFANECVGSLTAGTQLVNRASIALYQKTNFSLISAGYTLHRH